MAPTTVTDGGFGEEGSMSKMSSGSVTPTPTTATNETAMRQVIPCFLDEAPVVFRNTEQFDMSKRRWKTPRPRNEAPATLSKSYSQAFGPRNETPMIPSHPYYSQNPGSMYDAPTIMPTNYYLQSSRPTYEAPMIPPNNTGSRDMAGSSNSNYPDAHSGGSRRVMDNLHLSAKPGSSRDTYENYFNGTSSMRQGPLTASKNQSGGVRTEHSNSMLAPRGANHMSWMGMATTNNQGLRGMTGPMNSNGVNSMDVRSDSATLRTLPLRSHSLEHGHRATPQRPLVTDADHDSGSSWNTVVGASPAEAFPTYEEPRLASNNWRPKNPRNERFRTWQLNAVYRHAVPEGPLKHLISEVPTTDQTLTTGFVGANTLEYPWDKDGNPIPGNFQLGIVPEPIVNKKIRLSITNAFHKYCWLSSADLGQSIHAQRRGGIPPEEIIIPYYEILYRDGDPLYECKSFPLSGRSWEHLQKHGGRFSTEGVFLTRVLKEWNETKEHDQSRDRHLHEVGFQSRRSNQSQYKSPEEYLEEAEIESSRRTQSQYQRREQYLDEDEVPPGRRIGRTI